MGVKKQVRYGGDPLLMEVFKGLEETLSTIQDGKKNTATTGCGERTLSKGDPLFSDAQLYHQAERDDHETTTLASCLRRKKDNSLDMPNDLSFDPLLEEYVIPHSVMMQLKGHKNIKDGVVCQADAAADLLLRHKDNSLTSSHAGALYNPVLHEYIIPNNSMLELEALQDDVVKKRQIFNELQSRRDNNLKAQELLCDPLVHSYRMKELLTRRSSPTPIAIHKTTVATPSTYRKLNRGDELLNAFIDYDKLFTSE